MRRSDTQRRRRGGGLGYTIVEVMMALAVLSIGATGVIAMQKTTLIGNVHARNLATASAIASTWIERLRVDGLRWTVTATGQNTIAQTRWLNNVGNDYPNVVNPEGTWLRPAEYPGDDIWAAADVRGNDIDEATVPLEAAYCTHIRLSQLTDNMIRAEVRVFWLRYSDAPYDPAGGSGWSGTIGGQPLCSANPGYIAAVGAAVERYHFVYLATAVLRNDS